MTIVHMVYGVQKKHDNNGEHEDYGMHTFYGVLRRLWSPCRRESSGGQGSLDRVKSRSSAAALRS